MKTDARIFTAGIAVLAMLLAGPASAERKAGDIIGRIGMTNVDPESDNGSLKDIYSGAQINVDDDTSVGLTGVYMFTDNLGIELLLSTPFEHDISVGGSQVGSSDQLPPTLSLQWHFNPNGEFHPYVGAGLNYTNFFNEDANGVDVGLGDITGIDLDDSWGLAVQAGIDFEVTERLLLNFDVRWIDIDSEVDVKIDGTGWVRNVGTADIDPIIISLMAGYKF